LVTTDAGRVAAALASGAVVGIPTDTVYGLAALASSNDALDQLFELKGRPLDLALPVLVADLEQAEDFIKAPNATLSYLAARFWPGALTIVVPTDAQVSSGLGGDGGSVGLRCPADDVVRDLCRRIGPLAVTSANRHGEPPITLAAQFSPVFGESVAVVFDGGIRNGLPSSVVSLVEGEPRCLREGPIAWSEIISALATGPAR
jgi:L-threonylcarbamoyladenylate synthase